MRLRWKELLELWESAKFLDSKVYFSNPKITFLHVKESGVFLEKHARRIHSQVNQVSPQKNIYILGRYFNIKVKGTVVTEEMMVPVLALPLTDGVVD